MGIKYFLMRAKQFFRFFMHGFTRIGHSTTDRILKEEFIVHTQQQGYQQNLQKGPVTYNHGGHEVNDVHEVLSAMVSFLEQCVLFRERIRIKSSSKSWTININS